MFNIKVKEKSYKMSFKALPVKIQKIQRPKTDNPKGGGRHFKCIKCSFSEKPSGVDVLKNYQFNIKVK